MATQPGLFPALHVLNVLVWELGVPGHLLGPGCREDSRLFSRADAQHIPAGSSSDFP